MPELFNSLETATETGPFAPHALDLKPLGGVKASVAELRYPGGRYPCTLRPEFSLTRTVEIEKPGRIENEFGRRDERKYSPGDFEIVVPETSSVWTSEGDTHIVMLALPTQEIDRIIEDQRATFEGDFGALHHATFRSEPTLALFDQLWRATDPKCPGSNLLAEGLFMAVVGQLIYLSRQEGAMRAQRAYTLASPVMRRLDDYIAQTGDAKLYMKDLAGVADMPLTSFARAFKATTGMTAHQYVMNQRLKNAQSLLRETDHGLAEVAAKSGFASQSHMTDVFRKKLGQTPGAFRKTVRH